MSSIAVQETSFLCSIPDEVALLKDELTSLQCFLQGADDKWRSGNASVANWVRRIKDATYEAENVIEIAEYIEKWNKAGMVFIGAMLRFEVLNVLKEIARLVMGIKGKDKELHEMGTSDEVEESLDKIAEDKIATVLYNFLKQRRFFVVLDDIWTVETWDLINVRKQVFPDVKNWSVMLLTARNLQVANQASGLTYVHQLKLLNEKESWHLFCRKAFPSYESIDRNHRVELESLGKNLSRKCNGIPLALVLLGGHSFVLIHGLKWTIAWIGKSPKKMGHYGAHIGPKLP